MNICGMPIKGKYTGRGAGLPKAWPILDMVILRKSKLNYY